MYMFVYVATKSTNFDFLRQQDTLSHNINEVNEKKTFRANTVSYEIIKWTCLVFNEALGPRNIKVNGGQFRRIEMIKITQLDHISRLKV